MNLLKLLFRGWFSNTSKKIAVKNTKELIAGLRSEQEAFKNESVTKLANLKMKLMDMERKLKELKSKRDNLNRKSKELYNANKLEDAAEYFRQVKMIDPQITILQDNITNATEKYEQLKVVKAKHINSFDTRISTLETKSAINDLNKDMMEFNCAAGVSDKNSMASTMKEVENILDEQSDEMEATTEVCEDLGLNEVEEMESSFDSEVLLKEMKEAFSK